MTRKIQIFDTTLRDGEQSPGASMNAEEKLIVARQLIRLGVDGIEEADLDGGHRTEPTHGMLDTDALVGLEDLHDRTGVGRSNLKTYRVLIPRGNTTLLCGLFATARKAE